MSLGKLAALLALLPVMIPTLASCKDDEAERQRLGETVYSDCVSGAMEWRKTVEPPRPPSAEEYANDGLAYRNALADFQSELQTREAQRRQYESDERSFIANVCPIVRGGGDYPTGVRFPAETALHARARDAVTGRSYEREKISNRKDLEPGDKMVMRIRSIALARASVLDACTVREIAAHLGVKTLADVPANDAEKIGALSGAVDGAIDNPELSWLSRLQGRAAEVARANAARRTAGGGCP